MSDKIRGALFNILGDIEGLSVLDAFAGSGALSFEAGSRGAAHVVAIDSDRLAQKIIAGNILSLHLDSQVSLIKASANTWLQTSDNQLFDIVICDPPYNDLQTKLIMQLAGRVAPDGLLVLSWPGKIEAPKIEGVKKIAHRSYGDAQLIFYQK
jgi:16S rRNA (guanine966-N2)-methyltransferase